MLVVSNTSPLIFLSKIKRLDLLKSLYGEIHIPRAAFKEIVAKKADFPEEVTDFLKRGFIKTEEVHIHNKNLSDLNIHKGEEHALLLAMEKKADLIILDDKRARIAAEFLGLTFTGTLGVLLEALKKETINLSEFKVLLKKLIDSGFRIDITVYGRVLEEAEQMSRDR
ncbi:MAG: DUF3368 domain-containing protein [Methanosarcinales archaeon]|nr:MAG: DUF3368 domain-containing protein [Methanosarcinales archaeon]